MIKEYFISYVQTRIKNLSLEEKKRILDNAKDEWIPSIINDVFNDKTFCNKCNKYSNTSDFKETHQREYRQEYTYTDAGYGDNDRYGEVEYLVYYNECPLCQAKKQIKKVFKKVVWEGGR